MVREGGGHAVNKSTQCVASEEEKSKGGGCSGSEEEKEEEDFALLSLLCILRLPFSNVRLSSDVM